MPGFWVRDAVYMPRPITPLTATTFIPAAEQGAAHGLNLLGGAGHLLSMRVEHGYLYYGFRDDPPPVPPPTPEVIARTRQGFFDLPAAWAGTILPRLQAMHAELRTLAPAGCTAAGAGRDARRAQAILEQNMRMHFEMFQPFGGGMLMAQLTLQNAGVPDAANAFTALIAGLPNEISDIDTQLLRLGAAAEKDPRLWALVKPGQASALVAALREDRGEAGQLFAQVWPRVRERPHTFDLGDPTWGEDPMPVLRAMAGGAAALAQAERGRAAVAQRRAETEARVRAQLPEAQRPEFDALLAGARAAAHLHQTHHYWMDELTPALCRAAFLRCAAPLVGRGLASAEDVAYLRLEELLDALAGRIPEAGLVERRRRERDVAFRTTPPATLGEPSAEMAARPVFIAIYGHQGQAAGPKDQLKGMSGSPGTVRGPARVVLRMDDLDDLQPGEILVAMTTDPAWTAVMGRAAGMVTETGGMLSHAAVVARERGVPAVVGARGATQRIRTGDMVEVDGEAGVVKLLGKAP